MIVSSKVTAVFHKRTVLDYLAGRFTYQSRETWQERIAAGTVTHNGRSTGPSAVVHQGDVVACDLPEPPLPPINLDYEIIYKDDWLLAVNKPGNLRVHGSGRFLQANLIYQLRHKHTPPHPEATLINRLDRDTSGVILLARDGGTLRELQAQFASRTVQKTYLALVTGLPDPPIQEIDMPIGQLPSAEGVYRFGVRDDGKPAQTRLELLRPFPTGISLVRLTPKTGRTHQLRVHLAALGHPIVADRLYTQDDAGYLAWCKARQTGQEPEQHVLARQALHCASTTFWHPRLKKSLTITAPLASDLANFSTTLDPSFDVASLNDAL